MSLINDALKRAQNAQPSASVPADGPVLRPDFAPRRSSAGYDFVLPALIVVILLLAALLLWQWFKGEAEVKVRARTIESTQSAQPATASTPVVAVASQNVPATAPEKIPATNATVAPVPSLQVATPAVATNVPIAAPPPPPAYKLQSIFYRAKNASAVINGKTLYIGDRVAQAHVVAIDKETVTILTASGEKKVLELPE